MKLGEYTDRELTDLQTAILKEQAVRRKLDASPEKIERVTRQYQAASGVKDGEPWEHPRSPLLRPMEGARRTHDGHLWRSTIDHNVFEPGVSGWKLEPETDPDTGEEIPPPFNRPSGQHDAYDAGDRITWTDGEVYEAKRDGVDWDPGNAPGDWALVEEESEPEPEPEEPPEDEEPVDPAPEPEEPALPEWKVGVDYQPGDTFTYQGVAYTVVQAHASAAHWLPPDLPSLYERQG